MLERVAAARPHWIPATVLLRELREAGYEGGISQLKVFLAPHKHAEAEPLVRFETPPGKQMQADFTVIRRGRAPLLMLEHAALLPLPATKTAPLPAAPRPRRALPRESLQHPLAVYDALLEVAA